MRQASRAGRRFLSALGIVAALAAGLGASGARSEVWIDERDWSEDWERRYQEYVAATWDAEVTHDAEDKALFGLELDCADAVYTMRIVFAYKHKLPFAINDPRGRRALLSNRSTAWDKLRQTFVVEDDETGAFRAERGALLSEIDKLRRFIDDVNTFTTTQSLANDTYPIPLAEVRPGDIYLAPGSHAFIVKQVSAAGAITTISASSPRAWRPLAEIAAFPSYLPKDRTRRDGYRRFKPIAHMRVRATKVPGASVEQWEAAASVRGDLSAFALLTQEALARVEESPAARVRRRLAAVCDYAVERVGYVDEAIAKLERLAREGRRCMDANDYHEYSTPSRDARLKGMFELLRAEMAAPDWGATPERLRRAVAGIFTPEEIHVSRGEALESCAIPVDYATQTKMTLPELWAAFEAKRVVSSPQAPRLARWGLESDWRSPCPRR